MYPPRFPQEMPSETARPAETKMLPGRVIGVQEWTIDAEISRKPEVGADPGLKQEIMGLRRQLLLFRVLLLIALMVIAALALRHI